MTVFFTKTCARDWERCCYQMLAISRRFPLSTHIVMIERDEFDLALARRKDFADRDLRIATDDILFVESYMPEAMRIEDPYLRQQYCKLRAPVLLGEDTIQLDSDMCPPHDLTRWADELFSVQSHVKVRGPRWFAPEPSAAIRPAVENWTRTYTSLFGEPSYKPVRDFMRSQFGWYIPRGVARNFFDDLKASGPPFADPIGRMLRVVGDGYKFSEYQLLGMWAQEHGQAVHFLDREERKPWLMHFSSTTRLTDEQRTLLRKAAGLEG